MDAKFAETSTVIQEGLALKASKIDLSSGLAEKVGMVDLNAGLALKANTIDVDGKLSAKANITDLNSGLAGKANASDVDTKFTETNIIMHEGLALKANKADLSSGLAEKANTIDVNTKLAEKVGMVDLNAGLALKANTAEVNARLAEKVSAAEMYQGLASKANAADVDAKFAESITVMYEGLAHKADVQGTLNVRGQLGYDEDLNEYRGTGIFSQNSDEAARSGKNYPSFMAGMLTVVRNYKDEVMCYQTYHTYGTNNMIYHRAFYNGEWSPWNGMTNSGGDYLRKTGNETKTGNLGIEGAFASLDKSEDSSLRLETNKLQIPNIQGGNYGQKYSKDISLQRQGGNVGIGTSAPVARLDVEGTGNFSGELTIAPATSPNGAVNLAQLAMEPGDKNEKGYLKILTFYHNPSEKYEDKDLVNAQIKYIVCFRTDDGKYYSPYIVEPHNYEFFDKEGMLSFNMADKSYIVVNYIKRNY